MTASTSVESSFDVDSFFKEYYDAWNGTDLDRIMSFYTEDVVLQTPSALMTGREAVRDQFVRPFVTAFARNRHFVKKIIYGLGVVTVEFSFEAEHTGPFEGNAATGARIKLPGCGVYEYDSGKRQITSGRIYFDVGTLLQSIYGTSVDIEDRKRAEEALRASELSWRQIVDNIPGLVATTSAMGEVEFLNRQTLEYFGRTGEELKEWALINAVHPEDLPRVIEARKKSIEEGSVYDIEYRCRRVDGVYRWFQVRGIPVTNAEGAVMAWYLLLTDIDDRKKAEDALQSNERNLSLILNTIPAFIAVCRPDGAILSVNQAALDYHGVSLRDVQKEDFGARFFHPDDMERLREELRALERPQPFECEYRALGKDGNYRWFLVRYNPLLDDQGRIDRWYVTAFDIEDRKRAEDAQARQAGVRADVSAAFSKPTHLGEILRGCTEAIVRHLDAAFARIWMLNKNESMLELQASAGMYTRLDGSYSRIPVGDLKVGWIAREKKAHLTNDAMEDPRVKDKTWAQSNGMVAFAGYPLVVEDRLIGVLALFARRPLPESILDTLASIADTIAQGIERKRAEEGLRNALVEIQKSESTLRQVIDAIPALAWCNLPDGPNEFLNKGWHEYTGLSEEESHGWGWQAAFHPDDQSPLMEKWMKMLASGVPDEIEARLRRRDGVYRWFLIRAQPFRDESGKIVKWYGTSTDIEDRKRAEDRLRNENVVMREEIVNTSMFEEIVGTSAALHDVLTQVAKVAPTDSTVLLTGETGTGKELIARAIHKNSQRSGHAFVAANCAAIPRELIASELFGHEKGAFTGAAQQRLGRFELASGGTIFLDEVGELPAETQIALLRVLQEREFERVGGTRRIRADVRVIAATNRDLQSAIRAGSFRSDLFYRLNVFPIQMPALRKRKEDIALLVEYFIDRYARKAGKNINSLSRKTLELIESYPWPGNIRELQNVIERSVILCETNTFSIDESWITQQPLLTELRDQVELPQSLLEHERDMIETALRKSRGRVYGPTGAAAKLGIPRSTLETKIRSLKIDKHRFKVSDPS